ncbi:conserved membrane hypothetical protein [Rubrivivax sp. A210]|uniref:EI24 domain-containing protein n=1 Tax=Rubrivivax sp. A210 TaxID=2772301 RepID=UPI001918591C|nr:EI24 domain-containing protein [Rubrivivax sp. A210]CAD5372836.1 conserved membrane hypothetical protein [Rubrivivax sp. A210]
MRDIADALWRAAAYCLHPKVLLWSLLPLALAGGAVGLLGWAYWETTVAAVRSALEQGELVLALLQWLDSAGLQRLRSLLAPMIVVALSVPLVLVLTLLLVAFVVTPAVARLVVARRFPGLQRREGVSGWKALLWPLACTAAALLALALSVPLWFVPPLVLVLPPLIWGWLTCRVLAFDVLASYASASERHAVMRSRRWSLLAIGVCCGYLGALPSLVWAASAAALIFAPLLAVVSVWLYTIVFAFASCWFAHFCLADLQRLRLSEARPALVAIEGSAP